MEQNEMETGRRQAERVRKQRPRFLGFCQNLPSQKKGEVGRKAAISWAKADFIHSVSHSQTKGVIPPARRK